MLNVPKRHPYNSILPLREDEETVVLLIENTILVAAPLPGHTIPSTPCDAEVSCECILLLETVQFCFDLG
jgi:hypothetical protein